MKLAIATRGVQSFLLVDRSGVHWIMSQAPGNEMHVSNHDLSSQSDMRPTNPPAFTLILPASGGLAASAY